MTDEPAMRNLGFRYESLDDRYATGRVPRHPWETRRAPAVRYTVEARHS
jgi:hypothetical protein